MKGESPRVGEALARCLRLRCPVCGRASIVQRPFQIRHACTACGALFKREEGFFVGAIMTNVVTTEAFILLLYLALLPFVGVQFQLLITLLCAAAFLFPIAFYHHSWSIWLTLDHLVERLPHAGEKD